MVHGMQPASLQVSLCSYPTPAIDAGNEGWAVIEVVTFKLRHNATSAQMQAVAYEIRTNFIARCPVFFWLESASKPSLDVKEATGSAIRTEDKTLTCSTN